VDGKVQKLGNFALQVDDKFKPDRRATEFDLERPARAAGRWASCIRCTRAWLKTLGVDPRPARQRPAPTCRTTKPSLPNVFSAGEHAAAGQFAGGGGQFADTKAASAARRRSIKFPDGIDDALPR